MKIHRIELDCANLQELRHFYCQKFNFPLVREEDDCFVLKIGASELCFRQNKLRKSYYHFAINISFAAMEQALDWLHEKVEVLRHEKQMIVEFEKWDARAIYFHDPAGNVVELIGRKNFDSTPVKKFSEKSLLNISEIGIPLFEVSSIAKRLATTPGLEKFDCSRNTFCALGDDEGLLILVDEAEKTWFPTEEPARSYPSLIEFSQGEQGYSLITGDDQFSLSKKKLSATR